MDTNSVTRKKSLFYDVDAIDFSHLTFSKSAIWKLLIPLMVEQFLTSLMGMVDSIMVTRVGSAAISAVSLTDSINVLVIQVFAALATGGTIVCSQYLGHEDVHRATEAAKQVLFAVVMISVSITCLCILFRVPLLHLIFGQVERDVMFNSLTYFLLTALSFPFIAIYQAGAAFYRAGGNSRFPLCISVIGNVLNIIGNAVYIFLFHWGVFGAALSTLLSRIFLAVVVLVCLRRPRQPIVLTGLRHIRPNGRLISRVLAIGIPSGIENGMFQFGKLAIQSSVSTLGTTAIAAQAMTIILENLNGIAAIGIGIGLMTIVGQTLGAGKKEEAKYYIVRLTLYAEITVTISCILVWFLMRPITLLAGLDPESGKICYQLILVITIIKPIAWTPGFIPAYGMRAAGDVRFSMILSTLTMWLCRVALATVLIRVFGFGPIAVWIGQCSDWAIRGVLFYFRFRSNRWLEHEVI